MFKVICKLITCSRNLKWGFISHITMYKKPLRSLKKCLASQYDFIAFDNNIR